MSSTRLRTGATVAVVLTLIVAAGTALAAAPGSPFRLGVINTTIQVTRLAGTLSTAVLRVVNKGSGPALELRVAPGAAPLAVNSEVKVDHLNADLLDGQHASAFLGANDKAANSDKLDGHNAGAFMGASVTKRESAIQQGTDHGDGTFIISQACNPGEILLSGGPANISGTSTMVESFPTPGTTNSWTARIRPVGTDNFSVVVLCASL
jgi:hypothetical protein